jgi:hypothetical protein
MTGPKNDDRIEDLEVTEADSEGVTGGVAAGDVNTDGAEFIGGDPDRPVIAGRVPSVHKTTDVTLKRG